MTWKDLVCLWLDENKLSWSNGGSAIWVGNRYRSIEPEHNYEVYIINRHETFWDEGPAIWGRPKNPPKKLDVWVLVKITDGWYEKGTVFYKIRSQDPTEYRYKVGHPSDPRFFSRLRLGINKMRNRYDGAGQCA